MDPKRTIFFMKAEYKLLPMSLNLSLWKSKNLTDEMHAGRQLASNIASLVAEKLLVET